MGNIFQPPLAAVTQELNIEHAGAVLNAFAQYAVGENLENDEVEVALAHLPTFSYLIQQLKEWNGNINALPDVDVLIDGVNEYVQVCESLLEN